ncbi:hypothetical protein [Streptomyces sp. NPDC006324]|uniref:hypothetical protein n=1 Tax=Streptomyces sp. NPDC006324 TaxID=3156751 RepID=UPI0033B42520
MTALLCRVLGDEPADGPFNDLAARLITLASEDGSPARGLSIPAVGCPPQASVPLPVGRWIVRTTQTKVDEGNRVGLVRLLSVES